MTNKVSKEWFVKMPWGRVAMISWGDSGNPPVLLVHGYLDTAASFIRLVECLPDNYYYVGFDLPGNGKSDPTGMGPLVTHTLSTEIVRRIVDLMGWRKFIFIGHSMAFFTGVFYHHVYPGKIKLMINIDPEQPVGNQYFINYLFKYWYKIHHDEYYENWKRYKQDVKLYTHDRAVSSLMTARRLSKEQAELLLTRCAVPVEGGLYKLRFEPSMRYVKGTHLTEHILHHVLASDIPPMLIINAKRSILSQTTMEYSRNTMKKFMEPSTKYKTVYVEGEHDVHITNPERLVPHIVDFLYRNNAVSKL